MKSQIPNPKSKTEGALTAYGLFSKFSGLRSDSDFGFRVSGLLHCLILTACLTLLCGCELPGVLLHTAFGEPAVAAQYVPPKGMTLVLVENFRSPDELQIDGDQISREVAEELKKDGKLEVVDPDKLVPIREDDQTRFRAMNIQSIGKELGAKQVIYVDLLESEVKQDASAGAVHGIATAKVKVVDVESGNTLWPSDASRGKEVSQTIEFDQLDPSHAVAMHTQMLVKLSSKIAKLFYSWKPDSQEEENTGG